MSNAGGSTSNYISISSTKVVNLLKQMNLEWHIIITQRPYLGFTLLLYILWV
jgi:hypothetical protein